MEGDPNRMAWYWMDGSSSVRSVSLVLLSFWSWCLGWVLVPLDVPSRTGFVPRMVRVVYWLLWSVVWISDLDGDGILLDLLTSLSGSS